MFKSLMRSSIIGAVTAALCLSIVAFSTVGCTSAQVSQVVAEVEAQIPTAIALTNTVVSVVSLFNAAPGASTGVVISPAVGTLITTDLNELETLCKQYETTPSTSVYSSILTLVDSLVTQGDSALLAAANITDPTTKAQATAALGSLDTILHMIDGYLQTTQTSAQIQATVARRAIKLKQVSPYFDHAALDKAAAQYHMTGDQVLDYETSLGF
jgi:hypothetical protein